MLNTTTDSQLAEAPTRLQRYLGCIVGLATGDALGTTLEFRKPGSFKPIDDIVGGGPFSLEPGQWTDDTSMALCLAESLIARSGFDPLDQCERYVDWMNNGHLSSNGYCFDVGNTVTRALMEFQSSRNPYSGPSDKYDAGNGSIMRLAPVPMFYAHEPELAVHFSGESSRTTHQTTACIDACRYLGGILAALLNGESKEAVLSPLFHPTQGSWGSSDLCAEITQVAAGSFKTKQPPSICGSGYVVQSLEAALWAFHHSTDFRDGALLAVNLGNDSDTTGAIYGQLAGAYHGIEGIPADWKAKISHFEFIGDFAKQLYSQTTLTNGIGNTTTLYRPVGPEELELIRLSDWKAFPPRLPEQPIFYPVTNEAYAIQIARDWNVRDSGSGFVTEFAVDSDFLSRYEIQQVGGQLHKELWVPAEKLDEFNRHIIGTIKVIHTFT